MRYESSVKLEKSVAAVRRLAKYIGCDVLDPNYRLNKRSINMLSQMAFGYMMIAYSCWRERHDALVALRVWLIVAKAVQAASKFVNVVTKRHDYPILLGELKAVLSEAQDNPSNEPILIKHMARLNFWQNTMLRAYWTAVTLVMISSILLTLITGEYILIFELYIPFVDEKTLYGYIATTACHTLFMIITVTIYPAFDSFFMILCLPIGMFVETIENEIGELNQLLAEQGTLKREEIDEKLRRIYRIHQMLVDLQTRVADHYSGHNWVLVTANMIGMVCSVFLAYIKRYYPAYGMLVAMVDQLSQYCILGTYITTKNQQMVEIVYTIDFYQLAPNQQRMVALMLHRAQNATEMTAGRIIPLNMETYVEVLKAIYSYITILSRMVD
ncbi:odorant receptor 67d-like [Toxorhynchites rutilus septentrionalis]|uniref:odorant receptor 67d-like n=1 Tax=Toxorhynchites rutilus septentrionalis TaxID=329112 RepID=UPI00247A60AA|nr:odorant receptor 67d-like [Toxorhynchites rutilus septentrionalis]